MENKEKNTETPSLDIKRYKGDEMMTLEYSSGIQIMTVNKYRKLVTAGKRATELKNELDTLKEAHKKELACLKESHELEVASLKNQLAEAKAKADKEVERIKNIASRKLTESQKQEQKVKALLEQQGKGRPSKLTQEHKIWIQQAYAQMTQQGQRRPIKDFYKQLVVNHGYTGNYEGVRAYISESRKNGSWLP
ncbi:hypothetical protein M2922_13425 (plasmid) [Enterococcus faecalis]|uniref:hypothetical protein n=1 Tax=Enterococcus faecalis TaxID=1351 RepID=UPI00200FFE2F|nr:hypothetical protein [Enterococcus faecalis]UQF15373.1 hypothetical protein M2922_13425 [Enterococcus faecalis]